MKILMGVKQKAANQHKTLDSEMSVLQQRLLERAKGGSYYQKEDCLTVDRIKRYEDNSFCGYFELLCNEEAEYTFTHMSEGAAKIFERASEALLENPFRYVLKEDWPELFEKTAMAHMHNKPTVIECRVMTPQLEIKWVRIQSAPVEDSTLCSSEIEAINSTQKQYMWHGIITDITECKLLQHKLEKQVLTDSLTQIWNHREFWRVMEKRQKIFNKSGESMGLLLCDFNKFKQINDQHGHMVGDELLRYFVIKVTEILPDNARFYRIGGDEFGITVCTNSKTELELLKIAVMSQVAKHPLAITNSTVSINYRVSIGAVIYSEQISTAKELYKAADVALYKHKSQPLMQKQG